MKEKIKVSAIYRITCLVTGSVYIGSSKDLYKRFRQYKQPNGSISKDIKESIQTYGIDNHEIRIMCEFDSNIPRKELYIYEDAFILLYVNRLGEDKILNSRCNDYKKWTSTEFKLTRKCKETTKQKISNSNKGKNIGKKASDISRKKISDARKGMKFTYEHKQRLREKSSQKGKFGKNHNKSKRVIQYSKDDIFIKLWDSIVDVERELGIGVSHISSVCKGKRKTTGGFKWKYAD